MAGAFLVAGVLAVFASAISIHIVKFFSLPYFWIAAIWGSVLICAIVLFPKLKKISIQVLLVIGVFAVLETYAWYSETRVIEGVNTEGTFGWSEHEILGYKAYKGVTQRETKYYQGEKLFDVEYTMDANGLRVTRPDSEYKNENDDCVLFFGDAYTFGWGINDHETVPYRVDARARGRFNVYNLSFVTHGPQQMLAMLENDLIKDNAGCANEKIKHIIYQSAPNHVRRVAGIKDKTDLYHGPAYRLNSDGSVSYKGQFGRNLSRKEKVIFYLSKSFLYRKLMGGNILYSRGYNNADVALYSAVVESAKNLSKKNYPNSEFHVLMWGNDKVETDKNLLTQMIAGLKQSNISVHLINDLLPGSDDNNPEFFIGRFDPHPNPLANDRIAEYLVDTVLN